MSFPLFCHNSGNRNFMYIGFGFDGTSSNGTFLATMSVDQAVPAGWIVVVAVNTKNTVVTTITQPLVDGVATVSMGGYLEEANCGQPGGNNWEHGWRSGYLSAPWAGGVLGDVTATVTISDQTRAFVWAFNPRGLVVHSASSAMDRSTISITGTAVNDLNKTIHANIGNSTDSSLTVGAAYTETGTPAPSNVQAFWVEGQDPSTQTYPMMLIDRIDTQPVGGVPWQLDIPGSDTGLGHFEWTINAAHHLLLADDVQSGSEVSKPAATHTDAVLYYIMDEASGNIVNTGSATPNTLIAAGNPVYNQPGITFDGTGDDFEIDPPATTVAVTHTSTFIFEYEVGDLGTIIHLGDTRSNPNQGVYIIGNATSFTLNSYHANRGGYFGSTFTYPAQYTSGMAVQVAVTSRGGVQVEPDEALYDAYINGESFAADVVNWDIRSVAATIQITIGATQGASLQTFLTGTLNLVAYYNSALSASTIESIASDRGFTPVAP